MVGRALVKVGCVGEPELTGAVVVPDDNGIPTRGFETCTDIVRSARRALAKLGGGFQ